MNSTAKTSTDLSAPATGERETELRGLITDVLGATPKITSTFSFEEFGALMNGLVFVLTPLLDRREGELAAKDDLFKSHTEAVGAFLKELFDIMVDPLTEDLITVEEMRFHLLAAAKRSREDAAQLIAAQSALRESEAARGEDSKRLDWLADHAHWHDPDNLMKVRFPIATVPFTSVRAAIDAARAQGARP